MARKREITTADDERWKKWFVAGLKKDLPTLVFLVVAPAVALIRYAWVTKHFAGNVVIHWALVVLLVFGVLNLADVIQLFIRFRKGR